MPKQTLISKDPANKKLLVTREFDAPLSQVWKAWTTRQLDRWWAPKPWRAETKTLDFRPGGMWLYCMVGPDGSKQWCRMDFDLISNEKSFTGTASFCDEHGKTDPTFPRMHWNNQFSQSGDTTTVIAELSFDSEADMNKLIEMRFQEGFTAGLANLEELLS